MKNFYEKVYDIVAQIPKGKVTTYGCIAMRLGNIPVSYTHLTLPTIYSV